MDITDWIGTVGVFILLLAYFLVVINVIETKGIIYILMNLFGALIAGAASYLLNYWPFIILEMAWTLVSAYSLYDFLKSKGA
jgi:hypothetical protein